MKKRAIQSVLIVSILLILFSTVIIAQTTDDQKVEDAYLWLTNQADGKWTTLDSETNALTLLALGFDDRLASEGKAALLAKQNTQQRCWPSASCRALDTAFAVLALDALGASTEEETDWLLSREIPFKVGGITWLLQVDAPQSSNCTITYDNKEYILTISEDKTYSWADTFPSCLTLTDGNYWMRISSGCLDKSYSISCDTLSTISIPYRLGTTLYIPSETFFSPADVEINTVCIREGATCNYEATMWTAYALQQTNRDYTQFLPYLIGEAEVNSKYLPDALLWLLSGKEEHAVQLVSDQDRQGFWSQVGGRGRYWDTALGAKALFDYAPENVTKARDWLLDNQNSDGSFGTTRRIRDTAFVLSSVWPKLLGGGLNDCEDVYGYFCRASCFSDEEPVSLSCLTGICCKPSGIAGCTDIEDCSKAQCKGQFVTDIFGRRGQCELTESICDDNFDNDNDGLTDMEDPECSVTCFELGGQECDFDQDCDVSTRRTLETDRCCVGSCIAASLSCGSQAGQLCDSDQRCDGKIVSANDASISNFCCVGECKSKRRVWPWIIILLAILGGATYYAHKKGFLDKYINWFKKTFKKKPKVAAPQGAAYRPPVRPYTQPTPAAPAGPFAYPHRPYAQPRPKAKPTTQTESELQRIINKLKGYVGKK